MSDPFSPRMAAAVVVIGVASATLALGLTALEPSTPADNEAGAHPFSDSAVGTRSLLRLLHALEIPARVATDEDAFRRVGVLAIEMIPPEATDTQLARAKSHIETAGAALIVLPKWQTRADPERRGWIESASLLPTSDPERALQALGIDCDVTHQPSSFALASAYSASPTIASPQLITDCPALDPAQDVFLARSRVHVGEVWVLSDPDILANHGIDDGHNAELAIAILADIGASRDEIVFDETIHGLGREHSLWNKLLSPPLSYAAMAAVLSALILVWLGVGRFGAPVAERPGIEPGKSFLIDNTAALLLHGGHTQHMLSRYLDTAVTEVLARHNADAAMAGPEAIAWLDGLAKARGHENRLRKIADEVAAISSLSRPSAPKIAACADKIYRWKREMLDS